MTATITRTSQRNQVDFVVGLEPGQRPRWYCIVLSGTALRTDPLVILTIDHVGREAASTRRFIPIRFGGIIWAQVSLVCAPAEGQRVLIEVNNIQSSLSIKLNVSALVQPAAALTLICLQPSILLPPKSTHPNGKKPNLRERLALAAIKLGPRISYSTWTRRYDCWEPAAPNGLAPERIMALVFTSGDQHRAALDATLASLAAVSGIPPNTKLPVTIIDGWANDATATLRLSLDASEADFLIVFQAGELIAPHALIALIRFAAMNRFDIAYADEDQVDFAGNRSDPIFKPEPSPILMLSGALATGVFLIRREAIGAMYEGSASCADTFRLAAWLHLDTLSRTHCNTTFSGRLPLILTHRRPDTAATPPHRIAALALAHLGSEWIGDINAKQLPLHIRPGIPENAPKVSLIIASTATLPHVRACLSAILEQTRYPNFEMVIVLSQSTPPSDKQRAILSPVVSDPRVRVVFAPMERFNYSKANNMAVQVSTAPLICLLNDDVAPITHDWLAIMVGHLQDERIAAVGAKLYYPEQTVQHAGVIIGLGGLCDHSFRFLPRAEIGYAARASVEQELSAVTAACMLIRKPVFDAVGGLDEHFASAFNDVDLCLKIRAAGHGIIWSAQAELWHHETVSFGKHYSAEHKPLADRDVGIMRERWAAECAADPFHNPNLSLEMHSEWELASPPRLGTLPAAVGLVACG